jgi:GGDEF domain-containing protein
MLLSWIIYTSAFTVAGFAVLALMVVVLDQPLLGVALGGALILASQAMPLVAVARARPSISPHKIAHEAERGRRLAIFDPTSGLLARWYFELRLMEETARAKRYFLSFVVLSVSGSASATDDGPLGSQMTRLSSVVTSCIRQTDMAGSSGFSGFTICLTHCDWRGAVPVVRRLMESLGNGDWRIGLAVYPDDNCEGVELIELAHRRAAPWKVDAAGGRPKPVKLDSHRLSQTENQELRRSA